MYIYLKGIDKPIYTTDLYFFPEEVRWAIPSHGMKADAKYSEIESISDKHIEPDPTDLYNAEDHA